MEGKYIITEIFRKAFGINIPFYITEDLRQKVPTNISFEGITPLPDYSGEKLTSWMGTPIFFSATLKGGMYQQYNLKGELVDVELPDLVLPPATMFQFRRAKNITRTNILGSNGTVKEIFGFDDWVIDVRGLCLDEPTRSAQSQLKSLLAYENLADAIEVLGSQFGARNIQRVCINEWSDNIPQATPGVIAFQFQLISDEPLEIIYSNL